MSKIQLQNKKFFERNPLDLKAGIIILMIIFISFNLFFFYKVKYHPGNLYFVADDGNDKNTGLSQSQAFKTIQHSVDIAEQKDSIRILPGIYRESVIFNKSGKSNNHIRLYAAPDDRGKVIIAGSQPSSDMKWEKCDSLSCPNIPNNSLNSVYYTQLVNWPESPGIIVENINGSARKMHLARDPDFQITTLWKYHQNWWTASDSTISTENLIDKKNLAEYVNLTGSTIHLIDAGTRCGMMYYTKKIEEHDKKNSILKLDTPVGFSIFGSQEAGLGPYTKYFIEGKPEFLNSAGEWYFDKTDNLLYLWPFSAGNPENLSIEIGKRPHGVLITNGSNLHFDGLSVKYIANQDGWASAFSIDPETKNNINNINLKNLTIGFASRGFSIVSDHQDTTINNISIDSAKVSNIVNESVSVATSGDTSPRVKNISITNSRFYDSSYRDNIAAIALYHVSNVSIMNNQIRNMGFYGIHISGYEREEIISKNIKIERNLIENVCNNISACAALKFWGGKYNDTVAKNNILKNNKGWSFCQEQKYGQGYAFGAFISNASGIDILGNIALKNTGASYVVYPRQIEANNNRFINNLAAYSDVGLELANPAEIFDYDTNVSKTRHNNTVVKNNIFLKNRIGIGVDPANENKVYIDYNAYIENADAMKYKNIFLKNVKAISDYNTNWDTHSLDTDKNGFKEEAVSNYNIPYMSVLRGRGEPKFKNPLLQLPLNILGLRSDIGPCKFKRTENSCPEAIN